MTPHRYLGAAAFVWGAAALFGCAGDNRPPALGLLLDRQVTVGESLTVVLTASDPDGDALIFSAKGLPVTAQLTARSKSEAIITYSPVITDTEPGGHRYDVAVEAADGNGGVARQTFGLIVFPTFGSPAFDLPSGVVLNLAQDDDIALLVEVKDDDSTDVEVTLLEGPEGAKLQRAGAKSAYFHWKPDEAQREVAVHRAILSAQDETHPAVEHALTLVLLNPEKQAGCEGTPPTVTHEVPADHALVGPLTLTTSASDADSQVQGATLHWTRGDPLGGYTAVAMSRTSSAGSGWSGQADIGELPPGGALVHYYFTTTDNDDPTGLACDQSARTPKTGWFTVAVYGAAGDACVDDAAEPDDVAGSAPVLTAGVWPGRRLCGAESDFVQIGGAGAGAGTTVTAEVRYSPLHGAPILRLLDRGGAIIAQDADAADGALNVRYDVAAGQQLYAEIASTSAATRLSYTLELGVDAVQCEDDDNEPDSDPAAATLIGAGAYPDRQLCAGDSDFYRVAMAAGQALHFALSFDHKYGDLDLELRDSDGVTVLATAASEKSVEELDYQAPGAKDVYLRVHGVGGARNVYDLAVTEPVGGGCPEDALGDNHRPEDARVLFQGVYEGFTTCADEADWFAVELNGGERFELLVQAIDGPLDVAVYADPAGAPVATGHGDPAADQLAITQWTAPTAGAVYYKVSTTMEQTDYHLLQHVTDPAGACAPDRLEPNGPGSPAPLDEGVYTWLRLCGVADVDAFSVQLEPFTTLVVITNHEPNAGYTDLRLLSPSGADLGVATDYDTGGYFEILLEEPGAYTFQVEAFEPQGESLGYDLAVFFD